MLRNLINKPVTLSIGEPWDFISDDGKNILYGVVSLVSDDNGPEWLKCDVTPFVLKQHVIKSVIAIHRYTNQSFVSLLSGDEIVANFLYESSGEELDSTQISKIFTNELNTLFIIGSIEVKKSASSG